MWTTTANALKIGLSWTVVGFFITTVVLALEKSQLNADLTDARYKLDYLETQLEGEVKPRSRRQSYDVVTLDSIRQSDLHYRLPQAVHPTHYDLYLHPDIEHGNFTGRVIIDVTVVTKTERIILHAHKLHIDSVLVTRSHGKDPLDVSFELDDVHEFLIIKLREKLELRAELNINIVFRGYMRDKIVGLYSSSYLTAAGEPIGIATSKFEPTYARQAFPCFDEPAMKATFSVTLVHLNKNNYHALSNMNEEETIKRGNFSEVRFAPSVPMSTYLACFIVSDFVYNSKLVNTHGIGKNFTIRIYARADQLSKASFALDSAVAVTEFYIQYFQVEYPLPKLDMAAIPDFASNAMEHWGLVTYRETALLYDKIISSTWNKQRVAGVIGHELAHMWFGNLVTMMWWSDLWLNEGFARYMEYKGNNEIYPDWGLPDQFLIHALHGVMEFDSSVASHAIVQTVENPDQITEMFDIISYDKGASIIRMLEDFVGADKFKQSVTNYLNKFKYRNAVTDDFISEVANLGFDFDVKSILRTWTVQMGLPVVNVIRISSTQFELIQQRFFANIEDYYNPYQDSEFNYTWTIPITYHTDKDSNIQRTWFERNVSSIIIEVPAKSKWLKLNSKQVGFYRVNYEKAMWKTLIETLKQNPLTFSVADRAHLLNDIFALADAAQLTYDLALNMTMYLSEERDFVPWFVATTKLEALQTNLRYTDVMKDYLTYARQLISKVYKEVTWTVDANNHLKNRLRVTILTTACSLGLSECIAEVSNRFRAWLAKPSRKPDPDLRDVIYYYGMKHVGQENFWDQMWQIYLAEQDASEKMKLMHGLSAIPTPWLLYRFIELAASGHNVRRQDYFTCLENIAANPVGEPIVWNYVRENWQELVNRFGLNDRFLGRMIPAISKSFNTETKLEEMEDFFAKYPEAGAGTAARKQAIETIKYNIKWLEENKWKVASWLKNINSKKTSDFHVRFQLYNQINTIPNV